MSKEARDEFLAGLAQALDTHLADDVRPSRHQLWAALYTATQSWVIKREDAQAVVAVHDRSSTPPRYGHKLVATGPFIPETDTEIADREARAAARSWAHHARLFSYDPQDPGDDDGECPPPPARVGVSQLLDQGLWWRARAGEDPDDRTTQAIRLADMTHDHRLALLGFLRKRAGTYKLREDWVYVSTPGPQGEMAADAFEAECDRQWETPAAEWLETRPLIQALVYWTTPVAESPLTWRPMDEAARRGTIIARWTDGSEQETYWSAWHHTWCLVGGSGVPGGEPVQWRELRDDERPAPVDPNCPHGVPDDEHCPDCVFDDNLDGQY